MEWNHGTTVNHEINDMVANLVLYDNYSDIHHKDPSDYDIGWDQRGPQFIAPFQCLQQFSFV